MTSQKTQLITLKIAVVGDVHDQWEVEDGIALKHLDVDLVLFVGDFGNESVFVVRAIASLDIPKAAVLGNHDAWYTATDWGRKKCPYDRTKEDWVQQQLDLLGETHVGYSQLDFPALNLTVVGGRPFSWGGPEWKYADFYKQRYGVTSFEESTARILAAVNFGDPDFAEAISRMTAGKTIPLVTFGHMHHSLRHTKKVLRKRIFRNPEGTIYLNAASVPRIVEEGSQKLRNFSIVLMEGNAVSQVSLVWVGKDFTVASEEILYQQSNQVVQTA